MAGFAAFNIINGIFGMNDLSPATGYSVVAISGNEVRRFTTASLPTK